jgi:hypothetical protein
MLNLFVRSEGAVPHVVEKAKAEIEETGPMSNTA